MFGMRKSKVEDAEKEEETAEDKTAKALKKLCAALDEFMDEMLEKFEALEKKVDGLARVNEIAIENKNEIRELKQTVTHQTDWMHQLVFRMLDNNMHKKEEEKKPSSQLTSYLDRKAAANGSSKPLPLP